MSPFFFQSENEIFSTVFFSQKNHIFTNKWNSQKVSKKKWIFFSTSRKRKSNSACVFDNFLLTKQKNKRNKFLLFVLLFFCYPWRCLCFTFVQITITVPLRRIKRHFAQIFFTDERTFILKKIRCYVHKIDTIFFFQKREIHTTRKTERMQRNRHIDN